MTAMNPVIDATQASGHFHAVRFYDNDKSLCRIVAAFLGEGLAAGQPGLIVGTAQHTRGVVSELREKHFDVASLLAADDLVICDAREMMSTFMVEGFPNAGRFAASAATVFDRIGRGRKGQTIRAYGEMVDLLWKDGHDVAAIKLEMLWNKLARTRDFSLLCGYSMGNFYKGTSFTDICSEHSHVVNADGTPVIANAGSLTIASLPDVASRGRSTTRR